MKYTLPILILFSLHAVFMAAGAYSATHLDSIMHLAGGMALGSLVYGALSAAVKFEWFPPPGRFLLFVSIFSLVTIGAVFWELFEWTLDMTTGSNMQPSTADTVKDLLLGQLGAVVYAFAVTSSRDYRFRLEDASR